jgi:hypothetical protein
MIPWLLAQLIAPPLQPGPIRLPEQAPLEQRSPLAPKPQQGPVLDTAPSKAPPDAPQQLQPKSGQNGSTTAPGSPLRSIKLTSRNTSSQALLVPPVASVTRSCRLTEL